MATWKVLFAFMCLINFCWSYKLILQPQSELKLALPALRLSRATATQVQKPLGPDIVY